MSSPKSATATFTTVPGGDFTWASKAGMPELNESGTLATVEEGTLTAPQTFTLSVSKAGPGSGTVTSSPAGINCGTDCSEIYNSGMGVTLTATAASGSACAGWSGDPDCSDGQVTMNANKTCIATFNIQLHTHPRTDVDGDGKADLVWQHLTTGRVYVWLMDGGRIRAEGSLATLSDPAWEIQQVGDVDGDGKADLVWRHPTTGQMFILGQPTTGPHGTTPETPSHDAAAMGSAPAREGSMQITPTSEAIAMLIESARGEAMQITPAHDTASR